MSAQGLEGSVNEQYDTESSMEFYRHIMGGGGDDIHYGIFHTGEEDLYTCSLNTVKFMEDFGVKNARLGAGLGAEIKVLDLGSGKGGASRHMATTFGCDVTCLNLGEKQNAYNVEKAKEAGIGNLIKTVTASFNEALPFEPASFDMVWSQEAFCHAADQKALMSEIKRVLKPGGFLVFSDIMAGEGKASDVTSFTNTNATAEMATPAMYQETLKSLDMAKIEYHDLTPQLTPYFKLMLKVVLEKRGEMEAAGVDKGRLDSYEVDLQTRFTRVENKEFAWGVFCCEKPQV